MTDISVITFTTGGRDKYLETIIRQIYTGSFVCQLKTEHHVIFQGCEPSDSTLEAIKFSSNLNDYKIYSHVWKKNIGIAAGLNKIIPECKGNLLFKADDDCKIVSWDLLGDAWLIHKAFPTAIFSPFPIGLVNNPAGPPGYKRATYYEQESDKYFQLRLVNHVGGFARFWPKNDFVFQPDLIDGISGTEDGQLSQWAGSTGTPMFYVETDMVVEHNEGLAQMVRYPEYFKNRINDLNTFKKWIG